MSMLSKIVTFEFRDGSSKEFQLGQSIKGLRDSKSRRPVKAVLSFPKDTELTKMEKECVYCIVIPSLDPMHGEVVYAEI